MKLALPSLNLQRVVESIAVLALVLVLAGSGWRLAMWTWRVLTPTATVAALDLQGDVNLSLVGSRPWFGKIPTGPAAEARPKATGVVLQLVGVFAGGGKPAAIMVVGSALPLPFVQGETITDGIVLKSIHPDHVLVVRDGLEERVNLPAKGEPAETRKDRKERKESEE